MPSTLAPDEVRRIAALARLELTADEIELFGRQLRDILEYVAALGALETSGVEPTSHPLAAAPAWREDEPAPSLDRKTVLELGPGASPAAGLFKVPKVL